MAPNRSLRRKQPSFPPIRAPGTACEMPRQNPNYPFCFQEAFPAICPSPLCRLLDRHDRRRGLGVKTGTRIGILLALRRSGAEIMTQGHQGLIQRIGLQPLPPRRCPSFVAPSGKRKDLPARGSVWIIQIIAQVDEIPHGIPEPF